MMIQLEIHKVSIETPSNDVFEELSSVSGLGGS